MRPPGSAVVRSDKGFSIEAKCFACSVHSHYSARYDFFFFKNKILIRNSRDPWQPLQRGNRHLSLYCHHTYIHVEDMMNPSEKKRGKLEHKFAGAA
jgi:hypothetical protein